VGTLGAVLLVITIFIRPQEFVPGLASLGLLNLTTGLAIVGIAIEFGSGKTKSAWTPQLPYLAMFAMWCFACTLIKVGSGEISHTVQTVLFSTIFMLTIAYAARTFERLIVMATVLFTISMILSVIGIQQSRSEFECIFISAEDARTGDKATGEPNGVGCVLSPRECEEDANRRGVETEAGSEYLCEKPGPFNTFSIAHGRVRWRGVLADPNELSLAIGAALAFGFALHQYMKTKLKHVFLLAAIAAAGYCVIQTQSRDGVLVIGAIMGAYFVNRFGWFRGIAVAVVMALPVLLLGGREGEEAESSTLERLGALYEGVDMFRASPIFGVGQGQFAENYFITAHNSYLLSAAELGFPGMVLWSLLVYVSLKIPFMVAFRPPADVEPRFRPFAMSLFVAFIGILVGITFLSFCYHAMLFIYFGMAGALYGAVRQTSKDFTVSVQRTEVLGVILFDAVLLFFLYVYTRIKGAP